jgi:hypothetical protein
VYWGSERDGVGAANLDGSEPQWDYLYWPYVNESGGPACGVAVDSQYLYWAALFGIGRRKLDGEGFYPATIVPHLREPCGLAIDQNHLYWPNHEWGGSQSRTGTVGRANLDGSGADRTFVTGLEGPCEVAIGGGHVHWVEQDGIGRADLDGSNPERPFVEFPDWAVDCSLAAGDGYLYWGQGEAIARANLEGGDIDLDFIPEVGATKGIALHGGHIYWAGRLGNSTASIGRARLDGSGVDTAWISSSVPGLFGGVAVDARPTPPNLLLPSRSLRFARNVRYNLGSGAVLLGVYVPPLGPPAISSPPQGQLRVTSPGLGWKVFGSTVRLPVEGNYYLWWIRIRPGKGAVGRRIRSQFRQRGWARVKVRLRYETERVYPVEATRTLILRRHRGARNGWVRRPGRPPRKRHPG